MVADSVCEESAVVGDVAMLCKFSGAAKLYMCGVVWTATWLVLTMRPLLSFSIRVTEIAVDAISSTSSLAEVSRTGAFFTSVHELMVGAEPTQKLPLSRVSASFGNWQRNQQSAGQS